MTYSEFLIHNLLANVNTSYSELPYDIQYGSIKGIYNQYNNSLISTDSSFSEYDSMVAYLDSIKASEIIFDFNGNYHTIELKSTDYVLYNTGTQLPIEHLDIIYASESIIELINDGFKLGKDEKLVSMTDLPKHIQNMYRKSLLENK